MSTKWEKTETNAGTLTVTVSAEEVNQAIEVAFKKNVAKANVPGFRKGKVPRQMYMKMYGIESLYPDAMDSLINQSYPKAITETEIQPVDYPEIDFSNLMTQFGKDKEFTYVAKVTVRPVPELGAYKGVEIEAFDKTVDDQEVDAQLKSLQNRKAEWVLKEEPAEEGDQVVMDFEGFINEETFEGGSGSNYTLELGSGQFIPGFEEQLIGKKAEEDVEVKVTFPEDYHAEEFAGKEAVFKVRIHELKTKELPALDDEFAKEAGEEVETVEELRAKIKERLINQKEQDAKEHIEQSCIKAVVANAKVEVPESMVQKEVSYMLQRFAQQIQAQGMNLETYYEYTGQDEAALREQMKPEAEQALSTRLILEEVANVEEITVAPEDLTEALEKIAKNVGMDVQEVLNNLQFNTAGIEEDIRIQKVVDLIIENSIAKA